MAYSYEPLNGYNGARPIEIKIEGPSGNAKVISSPCHRARANRYSGISRTALNLLGQLAQPSLSNPPLIFPLFLSGDLFFFFLFFFLPSSLFYLFHLSFFLESTVFQIDSALFGKQWVSRDCNCVQAIRSSRDVARCWTCWTHFIFDFILRNCCCSHILRNIFP